MKLSLFFILISLSFSGCTGGIIVPDAATSSTAGGGEIGSLSYRARVGTASYLSATTLASTSYRASASTSNSVLTAPIGSANYQLLDPLLDDFLN